MQLTAKLVQLLAPQTGTSAKGQWKKQDIIVETDGQYPKKICIGIWGDKASESLLQIGNVLKLEFDVESREYNGKWYTDLKAWKVELASATAASTPSSNMQNDCFPPPAPDLMSMDGTLDELPF